MIQVDNNILLPMVEKTLEGIGPKGLAQDVRRNGCVAVMDAIHDEVSDAIPGTTPDLPERLGNMLGRLWKMNEHKQRTAAKRIRELIGRQAEYTY